MALQAGRHQDVVALMEKQGWWERLAEFANNLDAREDGSGLQSAAAAFGRASRLTDAEACLRRFDDSQVRKNKACGWCLECILMLKRCCSHHTVVACRYCMLYNHG